jgi:hypothetical protein
MQNYLYNVNSCEFWTYVPSCPENIASKSELYGEVIANIGSTGKVFFGGEI